MFPCLSASFQKNVNPLSYECCQPSWKRVALLVMSLLFAGAAIAAHFSGLGLPGIVAFSIGGGLSLSVLTAICLYKSGKATYYCIGATLGSANAQYHLARCFEYGDGVKEDIQQAFNLYQEAAKGKHPTANCRLGNFYIYGTSKLGIVKNEVKAFTCFQQAANWGDSYAMYNLALCYLRGKGISVDKEKAANLFIEAVKNGSMHAKIWISKKNEEAEDVRLYCNAYCCEFGIPEIKDLKMAKDLYEEATLKGCPQAWYRLGLLCMEGKGVKKDTVQACENLYTALDVGHIEAAFKLIEKMANEDINSALDHLGVCYLKGIGVEKNIQKAIKLLRKAANKGYTNAQYNLAVALSENGEKKEANEWYKKAADNGHTIACTVMHPGLITSF